jgi:dolichol-phosphate mannosyltransferase
VVLDDLNVEYELIFVTQQSAKADEKVLQQLSSKDRSVLGLSLSRDFGTQAKFRRGMELATKNACVLLKSDLEDPPELLREFVAAWKEGCQVVYAIQDLSRHSAIDRSARTLFYWLFERLSLVPLPRDASDFCLLEKRVVKSLLEFPERDFFLRGLRAYAGFIQRGIPLPSGASSGRLPEPFLNKIFRAKRGLLAFSSTPLNAMSFAALFLFLGSILLAATQIAVRIFWPALTPSGLTTTLLVIIFFGSVNLLAVGLIGEYLATVLEEVKARPHSILSQVIKDGQVRAASEMITNA